MKNGIRVTYTIESTDKERIEKIAEKTDRSASWVIRKILDNTPDEKIKILVGLKE